MQKADIFEILEYLEPIHNCILMHIQNHFIFTEIGKPCVTLEIQNHDILAILEYLEPWNIYNLTHIQKPLKDLIWTVLQK